MADVTSVRDTLNTSLETADATWDTTMTTAGVAFGAAIDGIQDFDWQNVRDFVGTVTETIHVQLAAIRSQQATDRTSLHTAFSDSISRRQTPVQNTLASTAGELPTAYSEANDSTGTTAAPLADAATTGYGISDFVEGFTLGAVAGVVGMFIPAKQPQLTNEAGETVADPLPVGMGFTDEQMRLAREHAALEGQLRNLGQFVNENVPEAQRKARFDIMRRSLELSILAKKDELNKSLGIAGEGTGVLNNKKLDYLEYNISPGYWESWMGGTGERFRIYYDASVPGAYEEAVALGHKAMMKGGLSKIKDDIHAYIKSQELAVSFLSGDEIIGVGVSAMEGDTKGVVINLAAIILPGLNKIDEIGSGVSKVDNLGPNNALEDATKGLDTASDATKKAPDEAVAKLEKKVEDAVEEGAAVAPPTTMTPGAIVAPSSILSKGERLKIFNQRLIDAPAAKNADEAFQLLGKTMDDVEDAFSGIAKVDNPGLKYQGRMYPPRPDFTIRLPGGGLRAKTAGNIIEIAPDGTIRIYERIGENGIGRLLLEKLGGS